MTNNPAYPGPAQRAPAPTGADSWAAGYFSLLPVPGVNLLVPLIVMLSKHSAARRHAPNIVARENARNAANWALTMVLAVIAAVALLIVGVFLITEPSATGKGRTPIVPNSDQAILAVLGVVLLAIGITHLVITVRGVSTAKRGEIYSSRLAIGFFRAASGGNGPAVGASAGGRSAGGFAPMHQRVGRDALAIFPINFETEEVVAKVEELMAARGLPGHFSAITEEAYEYEEMGRRDDGLEGHFVTLARMNYALRPHQWVLMGVLDDRAGDNHAVAALHASEVGAFSFEAQTRGQRIIGIPPVCWQAGDAFVRVG